MLNTSKPLPAKPSEMKYVAIITPNEPFSLALQWAVVRRFAALYPHRLAVKEAHGALAGVGGKEDLAALLQVRPFRD